MIAGVSRLLPLVRGADADDAERRPVLDAALAAFLDFGIKRTSMAEVAKRSGLSLATVYRRFAKKPDLVQAVGLREVRRFIAEVDGRIDRSASAEEQIVEMFVAYSQGLRKHRLLARLIATEPELVLPLLTVRGAPVLELGTDYLTEFLERLQAEGKLPAYEVRPVAEVVARVSLSMALTPETAIPLHDDTAARAFARAHIVVALHVPQRKSRRR